MPFLNVRPSFARITRLANIACGVILMTAIPMIGAAASEDLGNGFADHGVAAPISNHRGIVATVDGAGRDVVLAWIMDHRGGYALLMIDAETGKAEQFPMPFNNVKTDSPYSSILSSANKFYTHFGDYFVEFDPIKRAFTFSSKTTPQMAMGMTEDDNGVIWSVTYPQSGVVSYDPKTRQFRDFGHVYKQNWPQYQRFVAADDQGWIYFALGETASQIVAFDPKTSTATPLLSEAVRQKGTAYVYRNLDGKVYGQAHHDSTSPWYQIYNGKAMQIPEHTPNPKPIITGSQALVHTTFPDGKKIASCDLVERKLTITDATGGSSKSVSFDYTSEGAIMMGCATAPNGTISGGTAFPMRSFSYDPKTDTMTNRAAYGQWNTITALGDKFFVGGYPSGYLLEWEPSKPWVPTTKDNAQSNPKFLTQVTPAIHRPHSLLALSDNSQVIMGGTPEYGYTGGGLLFWDRNAKKPTVLKDTQVIPDQSTMSMEELPGGKLLAGSTTAPGTGGEKKANLAELYIMDIATKKIEWHSPLIRGAQSYTDLCKGPGGLIYGFADRKIFFVFDPATKEIIQQNDVSGALGLTISEQGPRVFVKVGEKIYVLFEQGIAALDMGTHTLKLIAKSPIKLESGGDYLDGRIYFGTSSHICSYDLDFANAKVQ